MYNDPVQDKKSRIISIIADNEFGLLARVVSLFSARGYNIEGLNVSEFDPVKKLSKITIETICDSKTAKMITKLLERLVPVYLAKELNDDSVICYFALCKLSSVTFKSFSEQGLINGANIVRHEDDFIVFSLSFTSKIKLEDFVLIVGSDCIVKSACIAMD